MLQIETLLRRRIGLEAAAIGSGRIRQIIQQRMERQGLKSIADYEQKLRESPAELDDLIEAVVVTETWFFRDRAPFDAFAKIVTEQWLPRHPQQTLRILSVPCSSGEEPFSVAMTLVDAGVAMTAFQIDAMDISQNALTRAVRAVYGKNSFRGTNLEFRERHFRRVKSGFALNSTLRQQVSFQRANILDADFLVAATPYDFIFCRNLLIYFDRATQVSTLAKLHRSLAPDGTLFVGPAESLIATKCGFVHAGWPLAFACHKGKFFSHQSARRSRSTPSQSGPNPDRSSQLIPLMRPIALAAGAAGSSGRDAALLSYAYELAASGRHEEAVALCWSHLQQRPDCAESYYLIGLIHEVRNDQSAIDFYRKALYLDPTHHESLERSAVWWEQQGHAARAKLFRRRLTRAIRQRELEIRTEPNP